jgi:hypothetical protein
MYVIYDASRVVTVIMCVTVLMVLCAVAVMPTLSLNYTYEIKYLDVPVSNTQPGWAKCLVLFLLVRRLFNPFSTVLLKKKT